MQLTFDEIRSVTQGAMELWQEEGGAVRFERFPAAQREIYRTVPREAWAYWYMRALCTAGIRLVFRTDSLRMGLAVTATLASSRTFFRLEVFADEIPVGVISNVVDGRYGLRPDGTVSEWTGLYDEHFPGGDFEKSFYLGRGVKTVRIELPWSAILSLRELSLDDGAFIEPVRPAKKLLVLGDSISQGYDAVSPSASYASQLALRLGLEEFNNAIGGEVHYPAALGPRLPIEPDYITVGFGTNDWSTLTWDEISTNCPAYYERLTANYPKARIFTLSPIWRVNWQDKKPSCPFEDMIRYLKELTSRYENVTFIDNFNAVPHHPAYYADRYLHPNDEGFRCYADHVIGHMIPYVD